MKVTARGQSFQTLFSRLQQVKIGKLIDEDGEDISNVDKVLKQYNITLRDTQGNFRDVQDVLVDLNAQWKNFETTQKSEIAGVTNSPVHRVICA